MRDTVSGYGPMSPPTAEEVAALVEECTPPEGFDAIEAELAAMEAMAGPPPRCAVCQASLAGRRRDARCCGPTCRQRAEALRRARSSVIVRARKGPGESPRVRSEAPVAFWPPCRIGWASRRDRQSVRP